MSRGWESKSVEGQQAEKSQQAADAQAAGSQDNMAKRQGNVTVDAGQRRRLQELELQRERILSERTSSPHRRSALSLALADIEERLAELGWTIHL